MSAVLINRYVEPPPRLTTSRPSAHADLAAWDHHPSGWLTMNRDTLHFRTPDIAGFIAYRSRGSYAYAMASIVAPYAEKGRLLGAFIEAMRAERKRVIAVQIRDEDLEAYASHGFRVNQIGLSYALDLAEFSTAGKRFMKLRNKLQRARRAGIRVSELTPRTRSAWREIHDLTDAWLTTKGRNPKLIEFMVGELGPFEDHHRRVFVARDPNHRLVGFVSYSPSFGCSHGYMHDLSRRLPDAPPGVMELIQVTAIEEFRTEDVRWCHFGFTPFVGVSDDLDTGPARSQIVNWICRKLARHGAAIYPAQTQAAYKRKWAPQVTPEYLAWQGRFRLGSLYHLLKLTNSL